MIPDLTLEVIYYNQPTDFKMEFELCGSCNVRFLSNTAKNRSEFLSSLGKSVIRSRAIIALGSFNPLDSEYLPKIVARAIGYTLKPVDKEVFKISTSGDVILPETAMPLIDASGAVAGCLLESNDQAIILLTSDRDLRHRVVSDLVCPYLKDFSNKKLGVCVVKQPDFEEKAEENEILPENIEEADTDISVTDQAQVIEEEKTETKEEPDTEENTDSATDSNSETLLDSQTETDSNAGVEPDVKTNTNAEAQPDPQYIILEQPEISDNNLKLKDFLVEEDFTLESTKQKNKKRNIIKIIISIILAIAVLLASYFGYEWVFQPMQKTMVYNNIRELYGQTWEKLPENMLYKFGRLYQTNRDLFGWLQIPETSINYPVVSNENSTRSYYETHLFDGSANNYGTLYTNATLKEDFVRNIVVYGKDVEDGEMLSDIKKYLDIDHYKKAPTFTFDTIYSESRWKIFSVFNVSDSNRENYTKTYFFEDSDYLEYLKLLKKVSIISTGIDVNANDQIVTLALNTVGKDVFVVARKVRNGESPLVDITDSEINHNPYSTEDIPVIADNHGLVEITSEMLTSSEDPNMLDGASSRFEQQAPTSSAITVKPNISPVTSKPPVLSSKVSSSSKTSSQTVTSKKPTTTTSKKPTVTSTPASTGGKLPILKVTNNFNGKKVSGPANEIIAQILEAEMGSSYNIEALKAQAVAAYSWLLCNGSANNSYPSAPMKTAKARCIEAANAVAGQVAVYNGKVAQTYYYAISAGRTANCQDIWTASLPYLVSVDSSVDKSVSGYQTTRKYAAKNIATWAKESLNVDLTKISDKNKWFTCTYDANGVYVKTVKIGTVSKKGPYLRDSFFTSARVGSSNVLRSSAYTISYNKSDDSFTFTVRGYGHGVGMSQTGANAYAKSGWNYEKILKHYYTGITLGTYYA